MLPFLLLPPPISFLFIHSPIPRTIHVRRHLAEVSADRPGTAFGIPCFHTEFPVVRGAESSKEHRLPGNPWDPRGECSREHGLNLDSANKGSRSRQEATWMREPGSQRVCMRPAGSEETDPAIISEEPAPGHLLGVESRYTNYV